VSDTIDWSKLIPGLPGEGGEKAEPEEPPSSFRPAISLYRLILKGLVDEGATDYEARILADMYMRPMVDEMARTEMRKGRP
jgi:hypothetical protein